MGAAPGAMTCYRHPDRETGLSCSDCGRPICTDCATFAPVGIRCPDHSGRPQGIERVTRGARRATFEGTGALLTKALIGVNVAVYFAELAQGASINGIGGSIFFNGYLRAPEVAAGDWWRLLTSTFLHYGPLHLAMNMISLWLFGGLLEQVLGRGRFLILYLVSGLAGSAGALLLSPESATAGASGAIFGILGAALVLERQGVLLPVYNVVGLLIMNLVFTFAFAAYISIGGHLGGLAGGVLGALALSRFGRGHAAYGRLGIVGVAGLVAVGVLSIVVSYLTVRPYA